MSAAARSPRVRVRLTPMRRHVAAVITIAVSAGFVAIMLLAGNLVQDSLRSQAAQQLVGADVQIDAPLPDDVDWGSQQKIDAPEVPGARAVWPQVGDYVALSSPAVPGASFMAVSMLPPGSSAADMLDQGAMPAADDEIVLDPAAADQLEVGVGDSVTLPADYSADQQQRTFTVSGIAQAPEGSAFGGQARAYVAQGHAAGLLGPTEGTLTETWLAAVEDGEDPSAVAEAATDVSDDQTALTADAALDEAAASMMRGAVGLGAILAVFVVIALFTSAVVIANTFSVTIAQRVRSLALLRTLGATRSQVRRVVLRESLLVGVLGSVLGLVGGIALAQIALAVASAAGWLSGLVIVPVGLWSVLAPMIAGIAITLLASLAPMRAATSVRPLQALRPAYTSLRRGPSLRGILGMTATVLGVLALAGGTALALAGTDGIGVVVAILGGIVSFTGILIALVSLTRPLTALFGRVLRALGGLPARVATANVARTPHRSAATIAALLIGTTLMTMMAVGARTAQGTLTAELDSRRPIDLVISAEQMPQDAAAQIRGIDGIDAAYDASRGDIEVGGDEPMTLFGATPEAVEATSHLDSLAGRMADGTVLLGADRAEEFGVQDGQVLRIDGADGTQQELTVEVVSNLQRSLVTPQTLERLVGPAQSPVVLADFADPGTAVREGVTALDLVGAVDEAVAGEGWSGASADPGGVERESYAEILSVLLGITVGLLAVAVLVALVGVANTLSLGVVERTGENALLRALGTTRRQMGSMLVWEGVLLALVGALLGIVLGSVYGVLGIVALLGSQFPVSIAIPWGQVGGVLMLAVLAGALASVLPGRRAARTAPAAALADSR